MGLQQDIGYDVALPNPVQRAFQLAAVTKAGSWFFQRTLYRVDRPLFNWTDGKFTLSSFASGLPVILLTTTGAKSGLPRTMPVAGIPLGDDLVLMGTNLAQPNTPAWVLNLEAHPRARIEWQGRSVDVVARPATPEEREAAWAAATAYYRGFAAYRKRITERPVRILVLETAT